MFGKIVTSAVFAGCAAGLIAAMLQLIFVQPVLLQAELYESGQLVHFQGSGSEAASPHEHDAPVLANDRLHDTEAGTGTAIGRNALTVLFTTLVYAAYAFILVAAMALATEQRIRITARSGILWGLCGFVAVHMAPAIGLPPEVPGVASADLTARQIWWFATVGATALALWLIAFGKGWPAWGIATLLLIAPHLIGAPQPQAYSGTVPPELASLFGARALGVGLAAWTILGLACGYFWHRADDSVPRPA